MEILKIERMKKHLVILGLLVCGFAGQIFGQQYAITPEMQGIYTQYYINPVLLNPAFTGVSGKYNLFLNCICKFSHSCSFFIKVCL